jgi:F0F1-type ATP synthase assembly protein I
VGNAPWSFPKTFKPLAKMKKNDIKPSLFNYAKYSSLAFQMLVVILIGVLGGIKLDQYLQLKFPVFTILFSIAAVFIATYLGMKDFIKRPPKPSQKIDHNDE